MAPQVSTTLILLTLLTAVAASQSCNVSVPFSTKLVGRRFYQFDDCNLPKIKSEVQVSARRFVLTPFILNTFLAPVCDERYVFHPRRDGKDPFIVYSPAIDFPRDIDDFTAQELREFCRNERPKVSETYFPVGSTRKRFIPSVRKIVRDMLEIRDYDCVEEGENSGFFIPVPGRGFRNVDLDGIVTYLLGVGFQYNFCAETE